MKLTTKKSKAIVSTCIAISMAGGAVFAAVGNKGNGEIGNKTWIYVKDAASSGVSGTPGGTIPGTDKIVDASTGASIMVTDSPQAGKIVDKSQYGSNPMPHKNAAKVVVTGTRSDFGLGSWAGHTGTAIGAYTTAEGDYSNAFGYNATVENGANGSSAFGTNATVKSGANNATAIGTNSVATKENEISFGDASKGVYHTLSNIADGNIAAGSHDAATGGQLYLEQQARFAADAALGQEIDNVGALSAALAGLHPLDYDGTGSKFQLATAMGNYDGKKAVALGGFYNANKNVLLSFAASRSFNNHKTAANVGATFRIGTGSTQSVPTAANDALLQKVNALVNDVSSLKQENEELKAQLAALQK